MLLQKLTVPLLVIMCYMSCGVQAAPTHSVTEIDEQVKVLYSGDQIIMLIVFEKERTFRKQFVFN